MAGFAEGISFPGYVILEIVDKCDLGKKEASQMSSRHNEIAETRLMYGRVAETSLWGTELFLVECCGRYIKNGNPGSL